MQLVTAYVCAVYVCCPDTRWCEILNVSGYNFQRLFKSMFLLAFKVLCFLFLVVNCVTMLFFLFCVVLVYRHCLFIFYVRQPLR